MGSRSEWNNISQMFGKGYVNIQALQELWLNEWNKFTGPDEFE